MKEWFKARNQWGSVLDALSDEEAGRLMKAIWKYTRTGEIEMPVGAEKIAFIMALDSLKQDEEQLADLSKKRAEAGALGGKQRVANQANALAVNQNQTNQPIAYIENKNKNKNIDKEQESESESFIVDDEAKMIQSEHDRLLNAAEDAGFKMSNDVRDSLIALYAEHGLQKMLDGLKSCVEHGAVTLAYLRAVLRGEPKRTKPKVVAQDFDQRDYSGVQSKMIAQLEQEMEEFKSREGCG